MRDPSVPTFDEAFWFPAEMNPSESFSRPVAEDGGADDTIGLPGRARASGRKRASGGKPPRKGGSSRWLWVALASVATVGILGYFTRLEIASLIAEGWLKSQGVVADVRLQRLSFTHVEGKLRLGSAERPDVTVESFSVDYDLNLFASGTAPKAVVHDVLVVRPVASLAFKNGKVDFGGLNRFIETLSSQPADPASVPPQRLRVQDASLRLDTDYGLVLARGGLQMDQGTLSEATFAIAPMHLSGPMGEGELDGGVLKARTVRAANGVAQVQIEASLNSSAFGLRLNSESLAESADAGEMWQVENAQVEIRAALPPGFESGTLRGPVRASLGVKAALAQAPFADLSGLEANLGFDGGVTLTGGALSLDGKARLLAQAVSANMGEIDSRNVRLEARDLGLMATFGAETSTFALKGPVTAQVGLLRQGDMFARDARLALTTFDLEQSAEGLTASYGGSFAAGRATLTDLAFEGFSARFDGQARLHDTGDWSAVAHTRLASTGGRYSGLTAMAAGRPSGTPDSLAALDGALSAIRLDVPALDLTFSGGGDLPAQRFTALLTRAARLGLNGGGAVTISPVSRQPLLSSDAPGAFDIALDGEGLPDIQVSVRGLGFNDRQRPDVLGGAYSLSLREFEFAPASGVSLSAEGRFTSSVDEGIAVTLTHPATFTAVAVELGDHLTEVSANVTMRANTPVVRAQGAVWRVAADMTDLTLKAPNSAVALEGGRVAIVMFSIEGTDVPGMDIALTQAVATDTGPTPARFAPMNISGRLSQTATAMKGQFVAATPAYRPGGKDKPLFVFDLSGDPVSGDGRMDIRSDDLAFSQGGMQASDISPLLGMVMTRDVIGSITFDGEFAWTRTTVTSGGKLHIGAVDFTSSAGKIAGFTGDINFTSLAPMTSDPGQIIRVRQINPGVPLSDLEIAFQLQGDRVAIERGGVVTPGGPIRFEPMQFIFTGTEPIKGVVAFDGLDFGEIVKATDLDNSLTFSGKLSGRIPFAFSEGHLEVTKGYMVSDGPGRVGIKRVAVSDVSAGGTLSGADGTVAQAPVNPMQELAFQAMEHLAFESIDAKVYSTPDKKLTFNFHIKGRSDPPVFQPSPRVPIVDLITGKWAEKPMNLPSNTPVELFLEVPINVDDIIKDLSAFGPSAPR